MCNVISSICHGCTSPPAQKNEQCHILLISKNFKYFRIHLFLTILCSSRGGLSYHIDGYRYNISLSIKILDCVGVSTTTDYILH